MHGIIAAALRRLHVETATVECASDLPHRDSLCFRSLTPGDLVIGDAKVVGSAQRRLRGALLQHGAVLLAASPAVPGLRGVREMAGRTPAAELLAEAVQGEWVQQTHWPLAPAPWTADELRRVDELVRNKYGLAAWNCKR